MNKLIIGFVGIILILAGLVAGGYYWFTKATANNDQPKMLETPPQVSTVNSLPLGKRPYVELVPKVNVPKTIAGPCFKVDMKITGLKNNETKSEYELEYMTGNLPRGVFGRRDFAEKKTHDPLFFGTESSGKSKCDLDITGGSLKLTFMGGEEYTLKSDYTVSTVEAKGGKAKSADGRLNVDLGTALSVETSVLVLNTFGLPEALNDKVLVGPYGIFVSDQTKVKGPITLTLQSHEVATGKVQFWDGKQWSTLEKKVDGDVASFEIPQLGVIVLTQ